MSPALAQRLALREKPAVFPVMRQRWADLLFLHWAVEPEMIQASLPKGLHVDTFEGRGWIGVVPFYMERIRPVFLPPVPWISWFLEMNVRTYVHDDQGNAGVWFYSLDCNQPLAVEIARRFFHLPYQHASMKASKHGTAVRYHCQREGEDTITNYSYGAAGPMRTAQPGSLEFFLVERYLLFSTSPDGGIHTGRVHHAPYTFSEATCDAWSAEPIRQAGFPLPQTDPVSALYSPGVEVSVYPLQRSRTSAA